MIAVDTNVLVYRLDTADPVKQRLAIELVDRLAAVTESAVLPWQVCGEFVQQLRRRQSTLRFDEPAFRGYVARLLALFPIVVPKPSVLMAALDLTIKHTLSHWDAMLVAACLEAGVDTLYTEDMGEPRSIESLKLVNPFAAPPVAP